RENTRPGGQWDRNKVYGSQLWPDIPFDLFSQAPSPDLHDAKGNYWNPLGACEKRSKGISGQSWEP
ncbi:MAG: hypothetical protein AAFX50_26855, partial [Acidobacteriota bacterium]